MAGGQSGQVGLKKPGEAEAPPAVACPPLTQREEGQGSG